MKGSEACLVLCLHAISLKDLFVLVTCLAVNV